MTAAIRTEGLVKRYRGWPPSRVVRPAVDGLDLWVPTGGITGLLGPNGAGKTTTVRLLLGLARPTAGTALVLGRDVRRRSKGAREEIAYVPAERTILGWMRVRDFLARLAALSTRWDADHAARLARRWEIDDRARLRELSTGTRSRLLLLAALARRPALLILDEPTAGLDPGAVDDALAEIVGAVADGATVLLVTHRLDDVDRVCDRVAIMAEGRAILQDDLDDLRATWRIIDVAGHADPARLRAWEEIADVSANGEHLRLLVRSAPDAVIARLRLVGAEVTGARPLTLREIYRATTRDASTDDRRDDLA